MAVRAALPGNLGRANRARKVSLVRLQAAIAETIQRGDRLTDVMHKLAGLTQISEVFCYPDVGDIVLVGPAEPWAADLSGRVVGIDSGRPTLLLEDMAVAIRAYQPGTVDRRFVGCTINPRREGLAKLQKFQRTIPQSIHHSQRGPLTRQIALGVRASLGVADVKVFGIAADTHFARVMIEADYRMKRIAVGVEPPPVPMTTFAAALTTARNGGLERWWFTPSYDGLLCSPDRLAMKIAGQGVQLQTENKAVGQDGAIVDSGRKPSRATTAFAHSFTHRYADVAKASPVYAQLRQLTDWLIVAAFMRKHDWYGKAHFHAEVFLDETAIATSAYHPPREAPVVVNAFWKQNRLFTPAGGGVSIEAEKALDGLADAEHNLQQTREENRPADGLQDWWWD
jgi:hypothetical protein